MLTPASLSLATAVSVQILARHSLEAIEVRTEGRSVAIQAPLAAPVVLNQPEILVPGKGFRLYPGRVVVTSRQGRLFIVNHIEEDKYLEGVLAGEAEAGSVEALKALAIAARSMIPFLKGRHSGADVCDLTHCQMYSGAAESTSIEEAVHGTGGRVVTFRGRPVLAPYHSTCGGETAPPDGFFADNAPHLSGVRDAGLCSPSPHYRWDVVLTPSALATLFGLPSPVGDFRIDERRPSGRVRSVSAGGRRMSGVEFYRRAGAALGWAVVKSTHFDAEFRDGRYRLSGRGLGHGVGLCQWGAEALARQGKTAEEILAFYFPGTEVSR